MTLKVMEFQEDVEVASVSYRGEGNASYVTVRYNAELNTLTSAKGTFTIAPEAYEGKTAGQALENASQVFANEIRKGLQASDFEIV